MAWIKFDKDLINDPRILRAAEMLCDSHVLSIETMRGDGFAAGSDMDRKDQLVFMRNAVTGALVTLWVYADTHIRNGDVLPISVAAVDNMVGIDGFCDLLGEDWIVESEDGNSVILPGYCEKNGLIAKEKRKTANALRQKKFREKSNAQSNAVSNGVSNATVTAVDLDLDLDLDLDHKKQNPVGLPPDPARQKNSELRKTAAEVIAFLNEKAGRNFDLNGANADHVLARLKDGATVEDLRAVVAKKCREWKADEKMAAYLRPETLFNRTKFASYKGELGAA